MKKFVVFATAFLFFMLLTVRCFADPPNPAPEGPKDPNSLQQVIYK